VTLTTPPLVAPAPDVDRWTAWDRFVEATPASGFMQSSWWAEFRADAGYDHFGVLLRDGGAVIGGAVVLKFQYAPGRSFYYIPEGPALPSDESYAADVFEAVRDNLDARRRTEDDTVSHLRIEPRWQALPSFVTGFEPVPHFRDTYMEPRDTLCIDLRPAEDSILAQMKPKGRYNIGVARRHGVTIVEDTSERGLLDFLSIYDDTASRQGFGAKPEDYFEILVPMLRDIRRGALFFAECAGQRIATALVVFFGRRATYFYGGSLASARPLMAPYLLHYEIMRFAKALGHEWYDLWGVAPPDAADHPWDGISQFKRKFGGVEVGLVPTMDLVYDAAAYESYVETVKQHT